MGDRLDDLTRFVWMLVGVVGFALLIACANIANLLLARAAGDPAGLLAPMRRAIQESDSQMAVFGAMTWREHLGDLLRTQEMGATLLGFFSLLALALTAVGVYGVMSYSISRRTQEIGVRLALGADRRDILKLIVRQGMALTAIGVVIG